MKPQFFISHSTQDAVFVRNLVSALADEGIGTWIPEDWLASGDTWDLALADAIDESEGVILVLSPAAVKSHWVSIEVSYGIRRRKRFFPVVCRSTDLPPAVDFAVGRFQLTDFTRLSFAHGVGKLATALRAASLSTNDMTGSGASVRTAVPEVYAEDLMEFAQQAPRRLLWKTFSLFGTPLRERMLSIIALRPWSAVWVWSVFFIVLGVAPLLWNAMTYRSLAFDWLRVLQAWLAVGLLGLVLSVAYALGRRGLDWITRRALSDVYSRYPHRPLSAPSNILLDHRDRVFPIVYELLTQSPVEWSETIERRCTDPALQNRVFFTMQALLDLVAPPPHTDVVHEPLK